VVDTDHLLGDIFLCVTSGSVTVDEDHLVRDIGLFNG
jgi:hypothetical protein